MEGVENTLERRAHWERIYETRAQDQVSWYQDRPEVSLRLIESAQVRLDARVVDVGGGASVLVDHLLEAGYGRLGVLDISERALGLARERLGDRAARVEWILTDVTRLDPPPQSWDLWHDRAVFHFLTAAEDRQAYRSVLDRALALNGHVVIATFGPEGPDRCSGLATVSYSPEALAAELGPGFILLESLSEAHRTPSGVVQDFIYCHFVRVE